MLSLTMGANAPIDEERFDLVVRWPGGAGVLDCSAFLLGATGKVCGDDDFIFYNQPEAKDGSVRIAGSASDQTRFAFDLGRAGADVDKIMVCAVVERQGAAMRDFHGLHATLVAGTPRLRFEPEMAGEAALRLVELYRRAGRWKIRAVGQGFDKGLGALARSFGVDVADEEDAATPAAPPPAAPPAPTPPPPAPPGDHRRVPPPAPRPRGFDAPPAGNPPQRHRRSGKASASADAVRLDDAGARHRWPAGLIGRDLTARLSWSSRCGGSDGRARALTLSLGAFYTLADGRRGALQSGDPRGAIGDLAVRLGERTASRGDAGQTLAIGGDAWSRLAKVELYAVIEGAPSWRAAEVELMLDTAGQPPLAAAFTGGPDGQGALALLRLAPSTDGLEIARLERYGQDQLDLDEELGWNLTWRYPPL